MTCFPSPEEIGREFLLLWCKVKLGFNICGAASLKETARTPSGTRSPAKVIPQNSTQQVSIELPELPTGSVNIRAFSGFIVCVHQQDVP